MTSDELLNWTRRSAMGLVGASFALPAASLAAGRESEGKAPPEPLGAAGARQPDGATQITPQAFGARGDGAADDTAAIQAALDHVAASGGGALYFPEGRYRVSAHLKVQPRALIRGSGRQTSMILSAHGARGGATPGEQLRNGSCLVTSSPINRSTAIHFALEDIGIQNANPANAGAAYYDTGGTYIACRNVAFGGFKYGVVLDQSELVDIDLCEIGSQNAAGAGVWIVNGADLTPGAASGFSNRISVKRCQINEGGRTYGIADDGGYAHAFEDNNYNGCLNHIRAAGVGGLAIRGGEFEAASGDCVWLDNKTLAGNFVGGNFTSITGGLYSAGRSAVHSNQGGMLSVDGAADLGAGRGRHPISGVGTLSALWLISYNNMSAESDAKDGLAQYVTVDLSGKNPMIVLPGFSLNSQALRIGSSQVVGPRLSAIPDDLSGAPNHATVNAILATLRTHGLIRT